MKTLNPAVIFISLGLSIIPSFAFAPLRPQISRISTPALPVLQKEPSDPKGKTQDTGGCGEMPCDSIEAYIEITYEDFFDGTKPDSSWNLAGQNFVRQGRTIIDQIRENVGLKEIDPLRPPDVLKLTLSNEAVKETEERRLARGEGVDAHPVSLSLYYLGCLILDVLFDERPIQRFWFLEIVARIPYFSYVTCLHLYESFGWFRAVELRKVHFAQGKSLIAFITDASNEVSSSYYYYYY
jgi:hypothetical protein